MLVLDGRIRQAVTPTRAKIRVAMLSRLTPLDPPPAPVPVRLCLPPAPCGDGTRAARTDGLIIPDRPPLACLALLGDALGREAGPLPLTSTAGACSALSHRATQSPLRTSQSRALPSMLPVTMY